MDREYTILIVARDEGAWTELSEVMADRSGYRVLVATTETEAQQLTRDVHIDLVVADEGNKDFDGCEFLSNLRVSHPDIVRVLVLAKSGNRQSKGVKEASVYQYVRKPLDVEQIALIVKRGLESRELARRHRLISREFKMSDESIAYHPPHDLRLIHEGQQFEKLVYASEKMATICEMAKTSAKTDLPILIQGETGTGKELLARAIHYNSSRKSSPLLMQNCGGMNDDLLQSELFGHKRGAFTGAISDRLGLFRAADGGTVFLDEISEVSPSFQVSLLRFLQEGEVKPLGSDRTIHSNVRIIAASNRPLSQLVATREFRRDLYYRLKGIEFEVPPLRDRVADISALAEFFAAKHSESMGRKILGLSANLLEKLSHYDFPGNVRELENEIRRLVALTGDGEYLTTRHLSPNIQDAPRRGASNRDRGFVPEGKTLKDQVESLERHLVEQTLKRYRWNQSKAAEELGLSRVGLSNKIRRYRLDEENAS
ncbi:sigma-54-dependent transcriptional regulator [Hyphomicrobium sp. 2TAF46]|uniref:sigma-54-dependent transcriptional regulator n=1 Tax=Hyphomicrobium sp. 2TAF46 TaxID=3233019 RepID=UPI003F901C86